MRSAILALLLAIPSFTLAVPEPTILLQVQPIDRLLNAARDGLRGAGGDLFVQLFDLQYRAIVEQTGTGGIDFARPWGISSVVNGPMQDFNAVIVLPITKESEFLNLLKRFGWVGVPEPNTLPGVLRFGTFELPDFDVPVFIRCKDSYAFISLGGPFALADDKLPKPAWMKPEGAELAALRIRMDRMSMAFRKLLQGSIEVEFWDIEPDELFREFRSRWYRICLDEPREIAMKLDFDAKAGQFVWQTRIDGEAKTLLCQAYRERPKSTNRFAGMMRDDSVLNVVGQWPAFDSHFRSLMSRSARVWANDFADEGMSQFLNAVGRTFDDGQTDFALNVRGPNADGHCTAVLATALNDTRTLERAMRGYAWKQVKPGIFEVPIESPKWGDVFGKPKVIHVALARDALFVAIGPDALAHLKDAMESKGGASPTFAIRTVPKRLLPVLEQHADNADLLILVLQRMKEAKTVDLFRLDIEGGDALTVTVRVGYLLWMASELVPK